MRQTDKLRDKTYLSQVQEAGTVIAVRLLAGTRQFIAVKRAEIAGAQAEAPVPGDQDTVIIGGTEIEVQGGRDAVLRVPPGIECASSSQLRRVEVKSDVGAGRLEAGLLREILGPVSAM